MLLFRLQRLWYCPNLRTNNTEPTLYVYAYTPNKRVYNEYTHHEHHCAALLWSLVRIYQIPVSQNKARKTLFFIMLPLFYAVGTSGPFNVRLRR